jgi:hypothetical protein
LSSWKRSENSCRKARPPTSTIDGTCGVSPPVQAVGRHTEMGDTRPTDSRGYATASTRKGRYYSANPQYSTTTVFAVSVVVTVVVMR